MEKRLRTAGIGVGLKLFFICILEMVVAPLWKYSTYTLQLLLGALWKHSRPTYTLQLVLGPLWEQSTYTLQLLLGALWKHSRPTYTLQLLVGPLREQGTYTLQLLLRAYWKHNILLTHCNCCWQPFWKQRILHYSCCWGPLWKHSTCTLQLLLLLAPLKARYLHIKVAVRGPLKARCRIFGTIRRTRL